SLVTPPSHPARSLLPLPVSFPIKAGGPRRPAGVRVDLRVEHEHLERVAADEHPGERLEADVVHRAVAADDPQRLVLPAHLVPPRSEEHTSELQSLTNILCRLLLGE